MPQFQAPSFLAGQKSKTEALLEPIARTIQSLPELYAASKIRRQEQEIRKMQQELEIRRLKSELGTGEAAPTFATAPADMLMAGKTFVPVDGGPEEQMFGAEMSMPELRAETPEEQMRRVGTTGFNAMTDRLKAEQQPSVKSQLRVTDTGTPVFFDPTTNALSVESGEPYDPEVHGKLVVPGAAPVLPAQQNAEITDITAARKQLRDLVAGADQSGFGTGNPYVEKARASKYNPFQLLDPEAQKFKQLVAATKQVIGKGLEGGVLRKEDEYKYDAILPKAGDRIDILKGKAQQLDALLEQRQQERVKGFSSTFRGVPQGESMAPINAPTIDSQEAYDALPAGAFYTDSNGRRARKGGNKDHAEAIKWAKQNPKDPRAKKIMEIADPLGIR